MVSLKRNPDPGKTMSTCYCLHTIDSACFLLKIQLWKPKFPYPVFWVKDWMFGFVLTSLGGRELGCKPVFYKFVAARCNAWDETPSSPTSSILQRTYRWCFAIHAVSYCLVYHGVQAKPEKTKKAQPEKGKEAIILLWQAAPSLGQGHFSLKPFPCFPAASSATAPSTLRRKAFPNSASFGQRSGQFS